jgi:ATP-dependent DNA helicase DinG
VSVADILREELFYRARAIVLTSATLGVGQDMGFLRNRLGIDGAVEKCLDSPFDFGSQAALYTPGGCTRD